MGATAFYQNITRFKTTHPLILFSEHPWPDVTPLKISPEVPFAAGKPHKFAINNVLWFTALKMARAQGYSHVLYLESDCRVGRDGWDGAMFDEYFDIGRPLIAGGTLAVYNPSNAGRKAHERWEKLVVENATKWQGKPFEQCRKNVPVGTWGWMSADTKGPSCVFPNGALGIYAIEWMHELFDLTVTATEHAMRPEPFDMSVGLRTWAKFEEDSYEVLGMLHSCYSGFGNVVTSISERQEMLTSGKICAGHQYKDEWQP